VNRAHGSTHYCQRSIKLSVAALREAIANPPLVAGLLHELRHEQDRADIRRQLLADAAAAGEEASRIESELAAAKSPADRAELAERPASALSPEVAVLEDAVRVIGGGA
jgi:signal transduction histidine kinase